MQRLQGLWEEGLEPSRVTGCGPGDEDRSIMSVVSIFLPSLCLQSLNKEQNYKGTGMDNHLLEEKGIQLEELLSRLRE